MTTLPLDVALRFARANHRARHAMVTELGMPSTDVALDYAVEALMAAVDELGATKAENLRLKQLAGGLEIAFDFEHEALERRIADHKATLAEVVTLKKDIAAQALAARIELQRHRTALRRIVLGSRNSMTGMHDLGAMASAALAGKAQKRGKR